jgi:hypothetical protein
MISGTAEGRKKQPKDASAGRSSAELERMAGDVKWIRTYVLSGDDGTVGTVCIFQAEENALRRYAGVPELRVSEILRVADTLVEKPDPGPVPAS